jgi:hypothetical protein
MKKTSRLIPLFFTVFFMLNSIAQQPDVTVPQLKKGDIERFIKHFSSVKQDFEKLDIKYSPESDLKSFADAIDNVEEVNTVVSKYGYSDINDFLVKTWAISASYARIKMDTDGSDEFQKAIKDIEDSDDMTPEQKEEAIAQMKQVMGAMESAFGSMANEKDIETVRPYVDQLEVLLNED